MLHLMRSDNALHAEVEVMRPLLTCKLPCPLESDSQTAGPAEPILTFSHGLCWSFPQCFHKPSLPLLRLSQSSASLLQHFSNVFTALSIVYMAQVMLVL